MLSKRTRRRKKSLNYGIISVLVKKMKIKDFSELIGIPASKIRYYQRLGLIGGERKDNNYRDFSKEDVLNVYHAQLLRSYGMGIEECQHTVHGSMDEIDHTLDQYVQKTIEEMERMEKLLTRLRTMQSYYHMFQNRTSDIHQRFLSSCYQIVTYVDDPAFNEDMKKDIRLLADNMPYSYVVIHVTRESLLRGTQQLDVRLGFGILKENLEQLGLTLTTVKPKPASHIVEQLFEMSNPFELTRSDLSPLLSIMEEKNIPLCELTGRIYCSYEKEGKTIHCFGLAFPLRSDF